MTPKIQEIIRYFHEDVNFDSIIHEVYISLLLALEYIIFYTTLRNELHLYKDSSAVLSTPQ